MQNKSSSKISDDGFEKYAVDPSSINQSPEGSNEDSFEKYAINPPSLNQEPESFGTALIKAPFRIGEDIYHGAMGLAKKIPDYYENSKTEVPGLLGLLKNHSLHALSQASAGATELGHNLLSLPKGIADYASDRLNLLPKEIAEKTWHPKEGNLQAIKDYFGDPKYEGESLIRGAVRNLPNIAGTGKLASALNPLNYGNKAISKSILKKYDTINNSAIKGFEKVSKKVNQRGISTVPIEPDFIESLKDYFPKTKSADKLLDKAKSGNYDTLRKLQTDLYTKYKDALKSPLMAEKNKGAEILEKRENIIQAISDHLQNTGNHDIHKLLNKSRKKFRQLQEVYHNDNLSGAIQNMVDTETRKVPENLAGILRENSKPMEAVRKFNPGLKGSLRAEKISSLLRKYALPTTAGAFGTYEYMKDK